MPWRRARQYSCLENSMDRGAWRATAHGAAESDMTEWSTLSLFFAAYDFHCVVTSWGLIQFKLLFHLPIRPGLIRFRSPGMYFKRWPLKVILWSFVQPLCHLLRNFIIACVVWKQRCGQLCATSRVALGFLETNSELQADEHLGPGPSDGSGNRGWRLIWDMRILLQS